jgi:hypothetical protein
MSHDMLKDVLAGVIRNAFFDARNAGETMYQASDVAAAHVLSIVEPSALRMQAEVTRLLEQWEQDRQTIPTNGDWRASVADTTLKLCINELRAAVERATPTELKLESAG